MSLKNKVTICSCILQHRLIRINPLETNQCMNQLNGLWQSRYLQYVPNFCILTLISFGSSSKCFYKYELKIHVTQQNQECLHLTRIKSREIKKKTRFNHKWNFLPNAKQVQKPTSSTNTINLFNFSIFWGNGGFRSLVWKDKICLILKEVIF